MRESAELRPRHKFFAVVAAALIGMVAAIGVVNVNSQQASAADLSQFRPGNIITDASFFNPNAMTEAQIQSFLNSKVSKCAAGYSCLKDHSQATNTREADAMCRGYAGAANESAARIIYKVAQSCGVNPQVILVMLQKEQGLVLDSTPSSWAWTASMGYACPDTAACDTRYYGFFNQVYMGIWQLKRYGNPPGTSNYFTWFPIGKPAPVRFSPNAACGSSNVVVENKATAALYYYTPYQPNAAALSAGYGASGDPCSAYGNRNFYNYFTDWFGPAVADKQNPVGAVDALTTSPESVSIRGWALDPDTTSAIDLHAYIDGVGVAVFKASDSRPDVALHYPASGANHGFNATIPVSAGEHNLCVYMINEGVGTNQTLMCRDLSIKSASPVGVVESLTVQPGAVQLKGWTLDPESAASLDVHIYAGGALHTVVANQSRPDLEPHYPGLGSAHGFTATIPLASGTHSVCAYGINVGKGSNALISCQNATVFSGSPFGAVDEVSSVAGGVSVRGWVLDPDTSDPTSAHVYVDGVGYAVKADRERPDIANAYPVYGSAHGYETTLKVAPGVHNVCVYGINTGKGNNVLLSCHSVNIQGGQPFGAFDSLTSTASGVEVRGWTIDPDVVKPIDVHIYIDGAGYAFTANKERADVGRAYPKYGANHGYSNAFNLPSGPHTVCVYAINDGPGDNLTLGCRSVTVG